MRIIAEKPDLILLVEVLPKVNDCFVGSPRLHIPFYTFYSNFNPDSSTTSSGPRGIAVYVADRLVSTQVSFSSHFSEHLWVKIKLMNSDYLLVGVIYRSPSTDAVNSTSKLCQLLTKVIQSHPPFLMIAGDFNYLGIDWFCDHFLGNEYQQFYDTINECALYQHVYKPTRYRPGSQPHIRDATLLHND